MKHRVLVIVGFMIIVCAVLVQGVKSSFTLISTLALKNIASPRIPASRLRRQSLSVRQFNRAALLQRLSDRSCFFNVTTEPKVPALFSFLCFRISSA
jgi:hypothetical protein